MPAKQIISDDIWSDRLKAAEPYFQEWNKLFKGDILDRYYEGFQWKSQMELAYNPYVINKVYETIQIKIAQFIPTFPKYLVSSRPANEQEDLEAAAASANLKEDLLNTIVGDNKLNFSAEFEQAYKDSFVRFGMLEVGYDADWIVNPNAPKPLLGKDAETQLTPEQRRRIRQEPPELPQNERIYIKHIPSKTFRVGGIDHRYLNRCGWCGYYEFVHHDEILSLPKLLNRDKVLGASGGYANPDREGLMGMSSGLGFAGGQDFRRGLLKVWRIWDMRAKVRLMIIDDPCITIFQRKFDRLPLFDFRPDPRLIGEGFYPVPPAYHWLSPQDEYNETREMLRTHRRRFIRKFQVMEGMVDDEELEKFETGGDGACIKTKRADAIQPIQNADLGNVVAETIQTSADDLREISGTSGDERGVSDRGTATEANIVNQKASMRENKDRDRVVAWYCQVGREILLCVRDNFTQKTISRVTSPEGESFAGQVQANSPKYRWVASEDLSDGYDFRIDVDLTSMSVTAQQDEKQKLLEYTAYLQQNPFVAFSPYLVREAAYRIGYRNEKAIAEFQQMALLMELSRMQQLQGALQPAPPPQNGASGQRVLAQATPPAQEQIRQQMQNMPLPGAQQQ